MKKEILITIFFLIIKQGLSGHHTEFLLHNDYRSLNQSLSDNGMAFNLRQEIILSNDSVSKMKMSEVFIGSIFTPKNTFNKLSNAVNNVTIGWAYTLGFSTMYSITAVLLAVNDWEPNPDFPPFLPISTKDYYLYQSMFTIPVGIVGVGINTYSAYGLLHLFGANVKAQELWGPISVASTVPYFFFTWLPETFYHPWQEPGTVLFSSQVEVSRQIIAGLWCAGLNTVAIKTGTKLPWWKSSIIGLVSTAAMGTFMLTFYR